MKSHLARNQLGDQRLILSPETEEDQEFLSSTPELIPIVLSHVIPEGGEAALACISYGSADGTKVVPVKLLERIRDMLHTSLKHERLQAIEELDDLLDDQKESDGEVHQD